MPGTFHKVVQHLVLIWAGENEYDAVMEDKGYQDQKLHPCRPDVVLTYRGRDQHRAYKVFVECQTVIDAEYLEKLRQNYTAHPYILIDIGKYGRITLKGNILENVTELYRIVGSVLDSETVTRRHRTNDVPYKHCEICGKAVKNLYLHNRNKHRTKPSGE